MNQALRCFTLKEMALFLQCISFNIIDKGYRYGKISLIRWLRLVVNKLSSSKFLGIKLTPSSSGVDLKIFHNVWNEIGKCTCRK